MWPSWRLGLRPIEKLVRYSSVVRSAVLQNQWVWPTALVLCSFIISKNLVYSNHHISGCIGSVLVLIQLAAHQYIYCLNWSYCKPFLILRLLNLGLSGLYYQWCNHVISPEKIVYRWQNKLTAMAQPDIFDPVQIMAQLMPEHREPYNHNLVDGMMVPSFITQQRVDELKTFKLHPDDVFVVTYPKSGICSAMMITKFEPISIVQMISGSN